MLDTQGYVSRKQLAAQEKVHPVTIWRWVAKGKVEKDTSTGVPLYRLKPAAPSVEEEAEAGRNDVLPRVANVAVAGLDGEETQRPARRRQQPQRVVEHQPPAPEVPQAQDEGEEPVCSALEGVWEEASWERIERELSESERRQIASGALGVAIVSGALYLMWPVMTRPAKMPRSVEEAGARRRRAAQERHSRSTAPGARRRGEGPPRAATPKALRSVVKQVSEFSARMGDLMRAKPVKGPKRARPTPKK